MYLFGFYGCFDPRLGLLSGELAAALKEGLHGKGEIDLEDLKPFVQPPYGVMEGFKLYFSAEHLGHVVLRKLVMA